MIWSLRATILWKKCILFYNGNRTRSSCAAPVFRFLRWKDWICSLLWGKRQDQYAVEKDKLALILENATLALHRKAVTKALKSSSGFSKGRGGGRPCMEWLSPGSQPVSMCFSPMAQTRFWLGMALPCPFFLVDYSMSAA